MQSQQEHEYLSEAGYFSLTSGFRNQEKLVTPTPQRPKRKPDIITNPFLASSLENNKEVLSEISQNNVKQQQLGQQQQEQPRQQQQFPQMQPRQQQQQQHQQFEVPQIALQNIKQQPINSIQGCGVQIDPKWLVFKPEKKKPVKNVQKAVPRQQNMHVDTTNCRYDRVKPQIDNYTNQTQYYDQRDDQSVIYQKEEPMSLFDQLLKLAPQPVEVQYLQTLNNLGPHSYCLGQVNGEQIEYIRRQNVQGYLYPEYRIQLD